MFYGHLRLLKFNYLLYMFKFMSFFKGVSYHVKSISRLNNRR